MKKYKHITFYLGKDKTLRDIFKAKSKTPLFKISNLCDAVASLHGKYLWFNSPDQWHDPFENLFYKASYGGEPFGLYGRCFISCFSPERVQEPQWNIYGKDNGLCFEINKNTLLDSIEDFCNKNHCKAYIGAVEYKTTADITKYNPISEYGKRPTSFTEEEWVKLLFIKRNAFLYENELRIVLVYEDENTSLNKNKLTYSDNLSMINSILIDPRVSNSNVCDSIHNLLVNTFGFVPFRGKVGQLVHRVKKSRLYQSIHKKNFK